MNCDFEALKREAEQFMSIEGNSKGAALIPDIKYVEFKEGAEAVGKISEIAGKIGYPFDYTKVGDYSWYPERYTALMYLILKQCFGWSDDDLYEMGRSTPSLSFILKVAVRFVSVETVYGQAPKLFSDHYDFGEMKVAEINVPGKRIVMDMYNYPFKITRPYFRGYFSKVVHLIVQPTRSGATHESCGENCDRYILTWE
jgi:hypothetical protein